MIGIQGKGMNTSQSGFSLVELMVVVAIIGALAMVAVPRVNRFIAKARTSEAQVNLGSLYTFNKNFIVEFQGYTSDFNAMGYRPEGNLRYNIGFPANSGAGHPNYQAMGRPAYSLANANTLVVCAIANSGCVTIAGNSGVLPPALTAAQAVAPAAPWQTFRAGAVAVIGQSGALDTWSINENKNLINTLDGTM